MLKTIMKAINFSSLAYKDPADIESALKDQADNFKWIENKYTDTQVFICEDDDHKNIVFRGTEFDNFDDWITNIDCRFVAGRYGQIHRGFDRDVNSVFSDIFIALLNNKKPLLVTGHSQGAACAELFFANYCYLYPDANQICIPVAPPRSFEKKAANFFGFIHGNKIYHVINNNDIVTRVPTRLMGYGHVSNINLNYLDEDGNLHHDISWWERFLDRVKGRIYDFGELGTDGIKDHSIYEYQRIWKNLLT